MAKTNQPKPAPPRVVPPYAQKLLRPRRYDHALVIPVINEGERIRRQLAEIAQLSAPVDVIIADGGSTDGSLAQNVLVAAGVHALLTKSGPGRLSDQLRVAFDWCLGQGFAGIVTVDGNGKDDVSAIPKFVERLKTGYDFVQGSRYRTGGHAINTPLDRYLATRLIHAPLISVAARTRYTDTTNGFRAYSRRLLEDPRLAPFRDVFGCYGLLFYLSIRAPRLGYRVIELAVTRCYPTQGPTPTKIAGWSGRFGILGELIAAVAGRYNPSWQK